MKNKTHALALGVLALAVFTASAPVLAQGPAPTATQATPPSIESIDRQARVWAASCAACHGTDGRSATGIPPIAGRDADSILRSLLEFKNGQRPAATVMHQHAKGYTEDELRRISRAIAQLGSN
jgi:cytochrome subunit of sulfide dehydrogenase